MRRIQCIGYGPRPCPAWWYHESPGRPPKRCPQCAERRRWLNERAARCSECGKLLIHPKCGGRPRVTCSEECYTGRRAKLRKLNLVPEEA